MIIDSTLREGEQRYGLYFDPATRTALVRALAAAGVAEIETGPEALVVDAVKSLPGARPKVSVWSPCREDRLRAVAALQADRVCLGLPVSDLHIEKRFRRDRGFVLTRLAEMLGLARELGLAYISVGLEDVSRADPEFALEVGRLAAELGASRLRLSDTLGLLTPAETAALVARFKAAVPVELAVHCHNDFGQATANALAALEAGADYADASLMGLGERAGIAATEQLAAFLSLRRGQAGYDLAALRRACELAGRAAGGVPDHAPVVGERLFWVESGLHAEALYKASELYEPFAPELLGLARHIGLGKKSGRAAVAGKLSELGLAESAGDLADLAGLTERVRATAGRLGRTLDEAEIVRLARTTEN